MALELQIFEGAAWVYALARINNTSGTPVTQAIASGSGEDLADTYALAFSAVVLGVSATVTVTPSSGNNPYGGLQAWSKAIVLDNATDHLNVIPGLKLRFSSAGGFSNAWTATIKVGRYEGVFDAIAGETSVGERVRAVNTGTGAVSAAKARVLTHAKQYKKAGKVLSILEPFAIGATEKATGDRIMPYVLTLSGTAGAGGAKVTTLSVDTVTPGAGTILDINASANVSGTGLKAVAGQKYRFLSGALTGVEFSIDPACANGDTSNLLIISPRFIKIAPDVAGVEGAYGTADVPLTEVGQAAGVITPTAFAYFWVKVDVPAGGNVASNPYVGDVALQATESGAAGWIV